eukprot:CAMPEP_0172923758 /NCGR_PEP_ID=MMETSP1075-20121228/210374_1 /TAXON_ID=2916 /ORGANISM="Ceratium fusus, Strain PA161109" /LENGTH=50 /DNA_ID=CAMNT_0013784299 /DNA_START=144 /DNA_END=292 /DNA_ORIENTATION=+
MSMILKADVHQLEAMTKEVHLQWENSESSAGAANSAGVAGTCVAAAAAAA